MIGAQQNIHGKLWIAVGASVAYVIIVTMPHGPGITSDSIHYITAARNLLESGQMRTYTGAPMVSYAPLLSWIYALWMAVGVDAHVGAIVTNAASFGVIVWITGMWLAEVVPQQGVWTAGILAVLLCRPLLWYAPYALSEAPFMALVMGGAWNLWRYVYVGERRFLRWGVLLSSLTPLMRYIGVPVVITGGIFILWRQPGSFYKRLRVALAYAVLSVVPLVVWIFRNRAVHGTFGGVREPSDYSLRQMMFDTLWSWHRWVFPIPFQNSVGLFGIVLLCLLVLLVIVLYNARRVMSSGISSSLGIIGFFVAMYGVMFNASVRAIKFEGSSERLWLPISIPVVLIGTLVYYISTAEDSLFGRIARRALLVAWVGWLVSGGMMAIDSVRQAMAHQLGVFSTADWQHSELVRYLRDHKPMGMVYSNFPEPLYYLTGLVAEQTPHRGPIRVASETFPRNLPQFLRVVRQHLGQSERVYIVWFDNPRRSSFMYTLDDLRGYLRLVAVKKVGDGGVYQVKSVNLSVITGDTNSGT